MLVVVVVAVLLLLLELVLIVDRLVMILMPSILDEQPEMRL